MTDRPRYSPANILALLNKAVGAIIGSSMQLNGSSSGDVVLKAAPTTTDYTLTLPDEQGEGALTNDGSGDLSWAAASGSGAGGYTNLYTYGGAGSTPSSGQVQDNGGSTIVSGPYVWANSGGTTAGQGQFWLDQINLNTQDNGGIDRSALLASITVGSTITAAYGGSSYNLVVTSISYGSSVYSFFGSGSHTGQFSFDNVSVSFSVPDGDAFSAITTLYVNKLDRNGVDVSTWLAAIASGDSLRISNDTASVYAFFAATGAATLSGSVYALPVSYVTATSATGTFTSGDDLNVSIARAPLGSVGVPSIEIDGSTSGSVTIKAAATTTAYDLTLPSAQGSADSTLSNDGSGNLTWTPASGGLPAAPSGDLDNTVIYGLAVDTSGGASWETVGTACFQIGNNLGEIATSGVAAQNSAQANLGIAAAATIASASTVDLSTTAAETVIITGTTTITSFGTCPAGTRKTLIFSGSLLLTYNATSLILPGLLSTQTGANDIVVCISLGSGNWICAYSPRMNSGLLSVTIGSHFVEPTVATIGYAASTLTPLAGGMLVVNNLATITKATTFAAPIQSGYAPTYGSRMVWHVTIDATGGYSYTFNSIYDLGGQTIPNAANWQGTLEWEFDSAKWRLLPFVAAGYSA